MEASARPSAAQKRLTLIAAILGSSVVFIDSTVVNVALPAIEEDLGGGLAGQQWVSNAYLVTLSSLILIGGSLGDIFGEKRIFSLGVVGFGVTSLLCAIAPTIEVLVLGRALQGVFGALLTPAALAIIVATFDEDERGGAVGTLDRLGRHRHRARPADRRPARRRRLVALDLRDQPAAGGDRPRADQPGDAARPDRARPTRGWTISGALMCAFGLAGFTFGLIRQPEAGWGDPTVFVPLVGGVVLLVAFLLYEARASHPMLPLSLFRRRNFSVANAETLLVYAGLGLLFFFLVLFLQQVAGYSALEAGTSSLPVTILMFLLSKRFGALADRHGPRFFMAAGPLVAGVGMALLLRLGPDVDYLTDLLPALVLFGVGLSMTVAPLTATVLAGADEHNAGIASGVNNAVARVAGLVGVAAVGAVVAASFDAKLDTELEASAAVGPRDRGRGREGQGASRLRSPSGRPSCARRPRTRRSRSSISRWASRPCWSSAAACSASRSRTRVARSRPATARVGSWPATRGRFTRSARSSSRPRLERRTLCGIPARPWSPGSSASSPSCLVGSNSGGVSGSGTSAGRSGSPGSSAWPERRAAGVAGPEGGARRRRLPLGPLRGHRALRQVEVRLVERLLGQVVGRSLGALQQARDGQDARTRQREQVLPERAVEQAHDDQQRRPTHRRRESPCRRRRAGGSACPGRARRAARERRPPRGSNRPRRTRTGRRCSRSAAGRRPRRCAARSSRPARRRSR